MVAMTILVFCGKNAYDIFYIDFIEKGINNAD